VLTRELRRIEAAIAAAATPERRRLVVLVGCVSQKRPLEQDERGLPRHWPAADLYTSPLFRLRRSYAERHAPDAWAILSAQFGFLDPDEPTAPYDFRLSERNARERWAWARRCASRVSGFGPASTIRVELHAGELYCRDLAVELARDGAEVVRPVQGMAIGEQLRWYRQQQRSWAPQQLELWPAS
jgi:hypothetical protein